MPLLALLVTFGAAVFQTAQAPPTKSLTERSNFAPKRD